MASSYQVFARKYRPRTFQDILGQDHVVRTLENAITHDRLHHAYLFVGPRGTGKTSTARILAKALNCPGGPKVDFDPDDPVCAEIAEGRSLDVLEIDGASNNGVEQVRELRENVKFAPSAGKFRIYYIDEVHMLTGAAFNALLKTLEEPPPHAKFIFATTEAHKVLPTIISRCQRFDLRRIPDKIIAEHLRFIAENEGVALDEPAAHAIAKGAEGGMRDAQSMLDQLVAFCGDTITESEVLEIFGFTSAQTIGSLAAAILTRDTGSALDVLHTQDDAGKDLSKLLTDLIDHLRQVLVHQVAPDKAEGDISAEVAAAVAEQASSVETPKLLTLIDQFAAADAAMKWSPNKALHFEIAIVKAVQTLEEISISDVILALRGGADLPAVPDQFDQLSAPPKHRPAPQRKGSEPGAPKAKSPAVTAPPQTGSPRRQGSPGAPATPVDAGRDAPANPASNPAITGAQWDAVVERFQTKLIGPWIAAGVFLEQRGNAAIIGFHPDDAHKRDQLNRPSAKEKVVAMIQEICGPGIEVKLEVNESVSRPTPAEPEDEDEDGEDDGAGVQHERPSTAAAPSPEAKAGRGSGATDRGGQKPPTDAPDSTFYEDPLVNDALEIFKGKIKSS